MTATNTSRKTTRPGKRAAVLTKLAADQNHLDDLAGKQQQAIRPPCTLTTSELQVLHDACTDLNIYLHKAFSDQEVPAILFNAKSPKTGKPNKTLVKREMKKLLDTKYPETRALYIQDYWTDETHQDHTAKVTKEKKVTQPVSGRMKKVKAKHAAIAAAMAAPETAKGEKKKTPLTKEDVFPTSKLANQVISVDIPQLPEGTKIDADNAQVIGSLSIGAAAGVQAAKKAIQVIEGSICNNVFLATVALMGKSKGIDPVIKSIMHGAGYLTSSDAAHIGNSHKDFVKKPNKAQGYQLINYRLTPSAIKKGLVFSNPQTPFMGTAEQYIVQLKGADTLTHEGVKRFFAKNPKEAKKYEKGTDFGKLKGTSGALRAFPCYRAASKAYQWCKNNQPQQLPAELTKAAIQVETHLGVSSPSKLIERLYKLKFVEKDMSEFARILKAIEAIK
jgi:hypothetical protein